MGVGQRKESDCGAHTQSGGKSCHSEGETGRGPNDEPGTPFEDEVEAQRPVAVERQISTLLDCQGNEYHHLQGDECHRCHRDVEKKGEEGCESERGGAQERRLPAAHPGQWSPIGDERRAAK